MFWELYQQGQIYESSAAADAARNVARSAESGVRDLKNDVIRLEQQVERLTLSTIALAELLRDKLGITEAQIEATIRDIDLRDGKLDGKLDQPIQVKRCEACDRVNGQNRQRCLYCGKELKQESFLFRA